MNPVVDHIQITVRDMSVAVPFYDRLMPLLGFGEGRRTSATIEAHELVVVEYVHPLLAFAISSPRPGLRSDPVHRRRPGSLHHLAFQAPSREEVDRLHEEVKRIGGRIVAAPREYPEYTPAGYYAVFFKDPDGIKYEVVTHAGVRVRATAGGAADTASGATTDSRRDGVSAGAIGSAAPATASARRLLRA